MTSSINKTIKNNKSILIRPMRYTDLDALIEIAQDSFSSNVYPDGMTPDNLIQAARMITRGRMIPFNILMKLSGMTWNLLVAELDGQVVGCGAYLGREVVEITNLMVHSEYRRLGIGRALLERRLEEVQSKGHSFVVTDILETNEASINNVLNQGFKAFANYVVLEKELKNTSHETSSQLTHRGIEKSDIPVLQKIEKQYFSEEKRTIYGSQVDSFFTSLVTRLINRLNKTQQQTFVYLDRGVVVGSLSAYTSQYQERGVVDALLVSDGTDVSQMLSIPVNWFATLGKTKIQVVVANKQVEHQLIEQGWSRKRRHMQFIRYF